MNLSFAYLLLTAAPGTPDYPTMTLGAWIYMLIVWSAIIGLNVFCFGRIFSKKK